ncbi:MAG: PQQ-dependent dehydrogenase, methanol/ethanol family [Proteobacteria bacterium]|jgi:quinohemoprotein ethanol dehydrogenase|nr:PQQ-dependent dehydrogenase, methanol/ethanol family [Pseudomonadota bacterium]
MSRAKLCFVAIITAGLLLPACSAQKKAPPVVDDAALGSAAAAPDEWLTVGRDYAETHFSPLKQIDATNVGKLGLAWSYDTQSLRGLEATPLVSNGVLYATTPWSNVFALDARTGKELWRWDSKADRIRGGRACCDVVNRGVALYKGKVYVGVIDGRLVALDSATGNPVWDVQTTPVDEPYTITGAPRVVDGKVIIGNGGSELGVRGFVSAYDAETGALAWRFYIVPGDPAKGPDGAASDEALTKALPTWTGEWWNNGGGGGTPWDALAYDPEARLLYVGTGNGSAWDRRLRSPQGGDNLYLSSIVALDVSTGKLKWHYQTTPGDTWDYTAVQHMILADVQMGGKPRKVIMQAPKNGFFYVLDRLTGELLSAEPYAKVTWAKGVDLKTGRPIETRQARMYDKYKVTLFPGPGGAHNWHPMSFNPATGLVYIPAVEGSFPYAQERDFKRQNGFWNMGIDLNARGSAKGLPPLPEKEYEAGTGPEVGSASLLAWDPVAGKPRWRIKHQGVSGGGTLTTAGNLLFQGLSDGRLVAYTADTGDKVWEVQLGNGVIAAPSTWSMDGKQYVSVLVGWGGATGLYVGNPTRQFKAPGRLFTFVLDGTAKLEPVKGIEHDPLTPVAYKATAAQLEHGSALFARRCSMCHGTAAASGGTIADLRYAQPATYDNMDQIVRQGAYQQLGMPKFDFLTEEDLAALKAYVLSQREALLAAAK